MEQRGQISISCQGCPRVLASFMPRRDRIKCLSAVGERPGGEDEETRNARVLGREEKREYVEDVVAS